MNRSKIALIMIATAITWVTGCSAGKKQSGLAPTLASYELTLTAYASAAEISPTRDLAPTPLPAPTLIPAPDAAVTSAGQQPVGTAVGGPGISIAPQSGEPRDVVLVTGSGWAPQEKIALHWGPVQGPVGPIYWTVTADANGTFSVGLIVLPRERWPGGFPFPKDVLRLRAMSNRTYPDVYWADFTYVAHPATPIVVARTPTATVTCPACW